MKEAITACITIILIVISVILGSSYINVHLTISAAKNYNTAAIDRIQASNFSPNIISEITTASREDGFPTTITDVTLYEDKRDVLVTTKYNVSFPFFGIVREGSVEGYAR